MSDLQRHASRPPRRDGGRGGYNRGGYRREGPSGGPSIDYRALVEYVVKSLAEKPEEVHVESFERGGGTVAIKVKLADGKARAIQHMMATTFWGPDGKPMSAAQFLERYCNGCHQPQTLAMPADGTPAAHSP